jgi:hypothetical protein
MRLRSSFEVRSVYPRQPEMMKMNPGARLGMAEAIAGDVIFMPCSSKAWNPVTL